MNLLEVIWNGGVIVYPSDTLWGLGGDATQAEVARKIIRIKGRPPEKGMVILVSDIDMLRQYVETIPPQAFELMEKATRPLTIVYPSARNLPPEVLAPDGSAAIRVVRKGFAHDLIKAAGRPLISTSANFSGQPPALHFRDIDPRLLAMTDYVVTLHRQKITSRPSMIVKLHEDGSVETIRP